MSADRPDSEIRSPDRYQLRERIAEGGMGEVWLAFDRELEREVAWKTIKAGAEDESLTARMRREVRALAQCSHPGIVSVHDFGEVDGRPFLVMEFVRGGSLRQRLADGETFDVEEAVRIAVEAAEALHHAHGHGVLHRDVGPGNILLDERSCVRLIDFGLVREVEQEVTDHSTHALLGTPAYMPPEQAFGAPDEVDERADIYSLGATLFEMLAGRPPFEAPTLLAVLRQIEEADVPESGAGPGVDAVLRRAMAKDREDRFADAEQFADALRALSRTRPELGRPPRTTTPADPIIPRGSEDRGRARIVRMLPWAALAVVLIVLLGTGVFHDRGAPDQNGVQVPSPDELALRDWFGIEASTPPGVIRDLRAGRFEDVFESVLPVPLRTRMAAALCGTNASLWLVVPGLIPIDIERPDGLGQDAQADAAWQLLDGTESTALERIDRERRDGRGSGFLDLLELQVLLRQNDEDFDRPRARALVVRAEPPLVLRTLFEILRLRIDDESEVDQALMLLRRDSIPLELQRLALQLRGNQSALAVRTAAELAEEWDQELDAQVLFTYCEAFAGIVEGERPDWEVPAGQLEEAIADEEIATRSLAAWLLGLRLLLEGQRELTAEAVAIARQVSADAGVDLEALPHPIEPLAWLTSDSELEWYAPVRDVFAEFGQEDAALDAARRLDQEAERAITSAESFQEREMWRERLALNALWLAFRSLDNTDEAVGFVLRSLDFGLDPKLLEEEVELEDLLEDPRIQERLR